MFSRITKAITWVAKVIDAMVAIVDAAAHAWVRVRVSPGRPDVAREGRPQRPKRRRVPRPGICQATRKARFRDHTAVIDLVHRSAVIRKYAEESGESTRRQERRSYKCNYCGGWHATSQPTRGRQAG